MLKSIIIAIIRIAMMIIALIIIMVRPCYAEVYQSSSHPTSFSLNSLHPLVLKRFCLCDDNILLYKIKERMMMTDSTLLMTDSDKPPDMQKAIIIRGKEVSLSRRFGAYCK